MDQEENIIDRDIELSVILPGDVIKSTTVNGSKPMMDLLVYLCAQYRLNPASYAIDVISAEKKQIKFKPNTPIGMLEVDKVILKPKQMDKKKPTPTIPEQTVRVVINYKKTQKTIVRVSPHAPLEELIHTICSKCDFDPLQTLLLKSYQSQEVLDWTKSLNELGLRELYAMNVSKATPTAEFNLSSLQDSSQNSQNLEKENKGFLSFFQRNKKKREQTASAPATPLISKPRPAFVIRSNTVSKQYDSNTLPSEMPKKRRAPLPPMPASQSVPQDLAQTQDRPCVVKSSSVDETNKGFSEVGIVRTGSLQLRGTSSVNSSLRRAKRKAPSPPPRKLQGQSDNSIETESESAESIHKEGTVKGRHSEVLSPTGNVVDLTDTTVPSCASCCFGSTNHDPNNIQQVLDETNLLANTSTPDESEVSLKSDRGSEYSLEEIDEKEEMHEESEDASLKMQEVSTSFSAPDDPLENGRREPVSLASGPSIGAEHNVKDFSEGKAESMTAVNKAQQSQESAKVALDGKPPEAFQPDTNNDHSDAKDFLPMTEERKIDAAKRRESNTLEGERPSNCKIYHVDICLSQQHQLEAHLGESDQKWDQSNLEPVKTQDVAIQATLTDETALSKSRNTQECKLESPKGSVHMHNSALENRPSEFLNRVHESVGTMTEFDHQGQQAAHDRGYLSDNQNNTCEKENHVLAQRVVRSPVSPPTKGYPLYRQDSKPKPKPSNEITRDYIPKVGMTTYKIVPPKSLETLKNWESDAVEDQETTCLHTSPHNKNLQEFSTQTEILNSPSQTGPAFRHEVLFPGNDPAQKTHSAASSSTISLNNAKGKKVEAKHSNSNPDHLITPLVLSTENKSCSPPAVPEKPSILSPTAKPSNFYLQMQRRASGHYVTSAIARSGSVNSPTQNEAKSVAMEKKLASPDQTSFPFPRTISVPSQLVEENTENGDSEKKAEVSTSPPVKMPKPLNSPPSQPPPLNLKILRTFVVPQPYSSSRPSPFALAVSSAVRRSQSFSKTCPTTSRPLKEQSSLDLSSSVSSTEVKNHAPLQSPTGGPQQSMADKKNNYSSIEQNRQVPSLSGHPTTAVCERGTAVALQRPDPEQIHQSLLAAIRSGEAAAKLRRVGPPSNTVAINGRSSLSSSVSVEARYNNH
ncbi:cordon-bleu protein-like 1 isoform X2 [Hemicordylus capensis]|nr:cordon-bleu protein-like 1 isoform X2 [Hemicordylus capensis]XP_053119105.1 cordon-bleu protein-like 1 isoform X2 [Hemicordylus capensis]XP_053119115.1 cordon-bleu protein-like 1 isoform X2 [Hemicordylus capensis]XP_053119125.1 cordon-bleu protein-like 1 isoform X2 [Hemicordylus capensis]XP_053119135.1 cordon-bleu protein-like 1 isoform X2 [Hemicordylus capensis]XP_053119144.1 cordon-bleu protein-like 1 isoform X2 [Hemicordylus capensis]